MLVGNRIGKDSILSRFAERPETHHTVVNAIDASGQPSWAEKYSREEILKLRTYMGERRFQKEYMNNPVNEGAVFLRKHIRYGKMLPLKEYRSLICYTDPSFKASTQNDFKATMLVGKTKGGQYHLLKAYADRTSVSNMVAWHYDIDGYIAGRVPVMYYMESNFIQDLMLDEFKKVGDSIGHQIPIRGDGRKKPDKFAYRGDATPLRAWLDYPEREREGFTRHDAIGGAALDVREGQPGTRWRAGCLGRCRVPVEPAQHGLCRNLSGRQTSKPEILSNR